MNPQTRCTFLMLSLCVLLLLLGVLGCVADAGCGTPGEVAMASQCTEPGAPDNQNKTCAGSADALNKILLFTTECLLINKCYVPTPPLVAARAPAPPCPAITFNQAPFENASNFGSTGQTIQTSIFYRQPDGNFTAQGFTVPASSSSPTQLRLSAVGVSLGTLPQAQRYFSNCRGVAPWTPAPHPTILADLPGTMSQPLVVTNLGGSAYAEINTNFSNNSIAVSLDSQSTLGQSTTFYPVGVKPMNLVVADFNGDGKRDVAALNTGTTPGSVSILLGNGNGILAASQLYNVGNGPATMTALDFNKDGRADLAVVNQTANTVSVLIANADGSMKPEVPYILPGQNPTANAIVAADFDGGGNADILVYSIQGFSLLHGNGDGTFQVLPQKTGYAVRYQSLFLAPGDFNNDGKPDLASFNGDGTVAVLLNAGDGSFPTTGRYVAGTPLSAGSAVPGMFAMDFNDDGNLDLVMGTGHPDAIYANPAFVTLLVGKGDGTFQIAAPAYPVGNGPTNLATADFNGDTRNDVVVAAASSTGSPGLWVLLGAQGGGFQTPVELTVPSAGIFTSWVATADINGDSKADVLAIDIVATGGASKVYLFLGNGNGTFQAAATLDAGFNPGFITAGDVNGDGKPDLFLSFGNPYYATFAGTTGRLLTANAGGGFNTFTAVPTGANTLQVALRDVNGDGKLDLVALNHGIGSTGTAGAQPAPGNVSVSLGNGNGTFQTAVNYTVGVNPTTLALADVNGDGRPDLIVGALTATKTILGVLINDGNANGTFASPTQLDTYAWPGSIAAADFDGDGKQDLAVTHLAHDAPVSILRGAGTGAFQAATLLYAGSAPQAVVTADFTGGGKPDLAMSNFSPTGWGTVNLFRNTAGIVPSATRFIVTAPASATIGVALNFTITAADAVSNTVTGYTGTVRFTSTDGAAVLPANATLVNGTGTFQATLNTAGNRTITATDTANASITGTSAAIAVSALAPPRFSIAAPATATAGTAFDITVTARDANNNILPGYAGIVHLTSTDAAAVLPADGTLTNGARTFSVTLKTPGTRTITATDTVTAAITGTSGNIAVAAPPLHFSVAAPVTATAGTAFNVTVNALDPANNIFPGYTGTVHFTSSDGAAVLPADGTLTNGARTFSVTLKTPGIRTITATDTVTASINGTSGNIAVAAPPLHFSVSAPAAATVGTPFNVTVNALDPANTIFPGYTGTVHFTSTDGAAVLPADATLINGTRTFSVTLMTAGTRTITVTDTVTASINGTTGNIAVGAPGAVPPTPVSVSPPGGDTANSTYTFVYTDPRGFQDMNVVNVMVNNFLDGRGACYLAYVVSSNTLVLVNDAGDAGGPFAGSVTLGSSATIQNSQCAVTLVSATGSGNNLTLVLTIVWKTAFGGDKIIHMAARDIAENNSDWQRLGVWRVPGAAPTGTTAVGTMIPNRVNTGFGPTAFTFTFSDTKGFADLGVENVLVNNSLDGRHACYVAYSRPGNVLFLVNDEGNGLLPGQSLAASGSTGNSQCTVSWGNSAVTGSGNNLTLVLNIGFTAAFTGNRVIWVATRDVNELNSTDWHAMATQTVK